MKYFNGFSLQKEEIFFSEYTDNSDFCVAGFSYGANRAFDYVYSSKTKVDRLILISPAFFQNQKRSFVRTQLRYFEAGKEAYVEQFLKNVTYPSSLNVSEYLKVGTQEELNALLNYKWNESKIREVLKRGTSIEVFLGEEDKIVDTKLALDFFEPLVTSYFIKGVGHMLK